MVIVVDAAGLALQAPIRYARAIPAQLAPELVALRSAPPLGGTG